MKIIVVVQKNVVTCTENAVVEKKEDVCDDGESVFKVVLLLRSSRSRWRGSSRSRWRGSSRE